MNSFARKILSRLSTEMCSYCGTEITLEWNVKRDGFRIYCPFCGMKISLCDECQHRDDEEYMDDCNYNAITGKCRFSD